MNVEEIRGYTIEKLNNIDALINIIVTNYFEPKNNFNFINNLLNTNIIEFGKKIKLLRSLDLIDYSTQQKLQKLSSIRNSFAHAEVKNVTHFSTKNEDLNVRKMIVVMNSNGKISKKYVSELYEDFKLLFEETFSKLNEISIKLINKK